MFMKQQNMCVKMYFVHGDSNYDLQIQFLSYFTLATEKDGNTVNLNL